MISAVTKKLLSMLGKAVIFTGTVSILVVLCYFLNSGGLNTVSQQPSDLYYQDDVHSAVRKKCKQDCEESTNKVLSVAAIKHVKTFVFFIGHLRSGHSIVGSLLDAHPHMVISHQSGILGKIIQNPKILTKLDIFNAIWNNSYYMTQVGNRRSITDAPKNYTLFFDGLYQGSYDSYIDVIGDKQGGLLSGIFMRDPKKFQTMLSELQAVVDMPIKVIHVIRNPFDNIATAILYDAFANVSLTTKAKLGNDPLDVDSKIIDKNIDQYFRRYQASEDAIEMFKLDAIKIHSKDLVMYPRRTILELCEFLGVSCSDDYLTKCINKLYSKVSRTRYRIQWNDYQIATIKENIQKFKSLSRYSYIS